MKSKTLHAIALTTLIVVIGWIPSVSADNSQFGAADVQKWVVDRMVSWAKPGITLHPPAMETFEDGKERYEKIAESVLRVVAKEDPIFTGDTGRIRTAALVLSVSMFESSYRKDVDQNLGKEGRGDSGRSWCLMQIQLGSPIYLSETGDKVPLTQQCKLSANGVRVCELVAPPNATPSTPTRIVLTQKGYRMTHNQNEGYSGQDLVSDRDLCFTVGLRILKTSFNACGSLPIMERLSAYASGNCVDGREASRRRVGTAMHWLVSRPPPVNDSRLVSLFSK